jgi:hypothetical protein
MQTYQLSNLKIGYTWPHSSSQSWLFFCLFGTSSVRLSVLDATKAYSRTESSEETPAGRLRRSGLLLLEN